MTKKPNLIRTAKGIVDDGLTIKPELGTEDVRIICLALEDLSAKLIVRDGAELAKRLGVQDTEHNVDVHHHKIHKLLGRIGFIVYGPNYHQGS